MNEVSITMVKARSPHRITIKTDPSDPHFSVVELRKLKTNELKASHYILTGDVPTWVSYFESDGFTIARTNDLQQKNGI